MVAGGGREPESEIGWRSSGSSVVGALAGRQLFSGPRLFDFVNSVAVGVS